MRFLFCTFTGHINKTIPDIIHALLTNKTVSECAIFAAGRLGYKIAGIQNNQFWFIKTGYKPGSINLIHIMDEIKYSILIFSNNKIKISCGFPKYEFVFESYVSNFQTKLNDIFQASITNLTIQNLNVQKESTNLNYHCLETTLKANSHLFRRIVYPDFLVHTRHVIRCYINQTNAHCAIDHHGFYQIIGAKSLDDIKVIEEKISTVIQHAFISELLN